MMTELITAIVKWIKNYADKHEIETLVVGVSGGIDSAVVERLCEKTGLKVWAIAMPMGYTKESCPGSLQRSVELANGRDDVMFTIRPIGEILRVYQNCGVGTFGKNPRAASDATVQGDKKALLLQGNLRSRIRANILYDYAGTYNGIVVGTGNKDEDEIGYFTKGGDGLVDICPLSQIHKSQVREMAVVLEVPQSIIDAIPSAGLWDGQTDEQDLGMTYDEVEWAIKYDDLAIEWKEIPVCTGRQDFVLNKVRTMRAKNTHKLRYPPVFHPDKPDDYQ